MRRSLRVHWLFLGVALGVAACASGEADAPGADAGDVGGEGTACRSPRLVCDDLCVDPLTDGAHCGRCDNPCAPDQTCDTGRCVCPPGETLCGTSCVNLLDEDAFCGDCETDCKAGESCEQGQCVEACPEPAIECDGACVDVRDNDTYCGDCETSCGSGERCADSQCDCASGRERCGDACVDTATSAEHCGDCGNPCPAGALCRNRECACPPGRTLCDDACVNTETNASYCGNCETSCPSGLCVARECADGCPDGTTLCDGGCVDTDTDAGFCGNCETSCRADQDCAGGFCVCPEGATLCGERCVDTDTSVQFCGNCTTACDAGEACVGGDCGCAEGLSDCGGSCVDTDTSGRHCGICDHGCSALEVCQGGDCVCVEGLTRCGVACVQVGVDPAHCLGCGLGCTGGAVCDEGECVVDCPGALTECNGACVDTNTSALHCGGCSAPCEGWERCSGGDCTCVDDFWEYESPASSGSFAQAVPLPVGTLGDTPHLRNLRLCGTNGDWYSVFVPNDGAALEIYLEADCLDTVLPEMTLWGNDATVVLDSDEADGSGTCPALFADDLDAGWVDLEVQTTAGEGAYELYFFPDGLAEVEPNEDPDAASGPYMADVDVAADLDETGFDLDAFEVFNARPARVTLRTSDGAGSCAVDTVMFLTDDLGVDYGDDDDSGPGLCSQLVVDLPAGLFYVYLIGYDETDVGPYELSVRYAYEVESEPNAGASFEGPFSASFGAEGVVFPRFDVDAYRVQLTSTASIRAVVSGVGFGCYIDSVLELSSVASGSLLGSDDDFDSGADLDNVRGGGYCSLIEPTSVSPNHAFAADLPAGLYTVRVRAFSDRVGPYNLSVEIVE